MNQICINLFKFPIKEVIQPHVPVRLPCYDFTPVTSSTLGTFLQTVRITTLGIASFHGVTGGVYKARERIHRCVADQRLLAIPSSWRRVAASNPNLEQVSRLAYFHKFATFCLVQCSTCVAQGVRGMMTWRHPHLPPVCNRQSFKIPFSSNKKQGLRSLRDLTQHLTTRADDSHAPPVCVFPKALLSFKRIHAMSNPGKVLRVASN